MDKNHSCVQVPRKSNLWEHLPYHTNQPQQPQNNIDVDFEEHKYEDKVHEDCSYKPDHRPPLTPNPVYPANATLPLLTPVAVTQTGNTIFVTASIPAEAIITLPTDALEIKRISKKLKISQCRFFNAVPPAVAGVPTDTPKLFLGGFVRKDIQYSQVRNCTPTTVAGDIRDFVIDIPVSGVVNLGPGLVIPGLAVGDEQEYEFSRRRRLGTGFPDKERLLSPDFTEFNVVSSDVLNILPYCELVYSQINEMDEQLDRVPLCGGPFEEGTFRTLQEKMVILVQVALTFRRPGVPF